MWDGAVHHLDMQPLSPIHNSIEMNETLAHIIEKLSKTKNTSHYLPIILMIQ